MFLEAVIKRRSAEKILFKLFYKNTSKYFLVKFLYKYSQTFIRRPLLEPLKSSRIGQVVVL